MISEQLIDEALKLQQRGRAVLERHFGISQREARKLAAICKERNNLKKDPGEDDNQFGNETTTQTNQYKSDKTQIMSAWGNDGRMMDIDQYCDHYNLPRNDIRSYKLVTHTGTPYYNIAFHENVEALGFITDDFIESVVKKHLKPVNIRTPIRKKYHKVIRAIFTDTHIGMTPDIEGISPYGGEWDKKEQSRRFLVFAEYLIKTASKGNQLIIDDLGDFMDGWDGKTVRREHDLPQNMSNEESFDAGVHFKVATIDCLVSSGLFSSIILNNICNDNHAGSFGYVVNSAVKSILEMKYPDIVKVSNHRKFINHYFIGEHCFIISHGKDKKNLKFGFKPKLDDAGEKKITNYIRENAIKSPFIEFSKGDSHQMLFDMATSDLFDYMNYPAFSPASEWVQTNFQRGRSGFVIQKFELVRGEKQIIYKLF